MDKSIEQLPDTFKGWLINNYSPEEIKDICENGAYKKRGMATDSEISQLYERYGDEILSQIHDKGGMADYFAGIETNLRTRHAFEGCLIWRAAEAIAREIIPTCINRIGSHHKETTKRIAIVFFRNCLEEYDAKSKKFIKNASRSGESSTVIRDFESKEKTIERVKNDLDLQCVLQLHKKKPGMGMDIYKGEAAFLDENHIPFKEKYEIEIEIYERINP